MKIQTLTYNGATGKTTVSEREMTAEERAAMEAMQQPQINYDQLVSDLIRERYTIDQEIAINRQRDTKLEEFQEYFDFCEECKQIVREALSHE